MENDKTAAEAWFTVRVPTSVTLPLVCPGCGDVGVKARPVTRAPGSPRQDGPDAYFCEPCLAREEAARTRELGRAAASLLLGIGTATGLSLTWGAFFFGWQLLLTGALALLPLGLAFVSPRASWTPSIVFSSAGPEKLDLFCRERSVLEPLGAVTRLVGSERHLPGPWSEIRRTSPWVLSIACVWLGLLHRLGSVDIRVVTSGDAAAIVSIDHRRTLRVEPIATEHPGAGRSVRTLGGRRHMTLVSEEGVVLADTLATLWPGRSYLLGLLPPGMCPFLEAQDYGERGIERRITRLAPTGPFWELPGAVDLWFAAPSERPDLSTQGGVRTALRLWPCAR